MPAAVYNFCGIGAGNCDQSVDDQRVEVSASELQPGDIIEVSPGARLPADGKLIGDVASFDESALTGEAIPVSAIKMNL